MSRLSDAVHSPAAGPSQQPSSGSFLGGGKGNKSRSNSKNSGPVILGGGSSSDKVAAPPLSTNGNNRKLLQQQQQHPQLANLSHHGSATVDQLLGPSTVDGVPSGSTLPSAVRGRLTDLFGQIVQEFEVLYAENEALHQQLTSGFQPERVQALRMSVGGSMMLMTSPPAAAMPSSAASKVASATTTTTPLQGFSSSASAAAAASSSSATKTTRPIQISQKIKTTYKASQSKILSSFKGGITNPISTGGGSNQVRLFRGHRDGVWDLSLSRGPSPLVLGTASADLTARIWCLENETCLLQYVGHAGSVNSIRFHPCQDLALTSSGDGTAHIWRAVVSLPANLDVTHKYCQSSGDEELDGGVGGGNSEDDNLYERDFYSDSIPNSTSFGHVSSSSNHNNHYPGGDHSYNQSNHSYNIQSNHSTSPPKSSTNVLSFNNQSINQFHAPTSGLPTTTATAASSSASQTSIGPHAHAPETSSSSTSFPTVRHPVVVLSGHTDVVVAADWIYGGSQIVTASWDRTANLFDAETHILVQSLTGHDQELTNVTCHPDQKLIVTSSKDTTFRLWDFRSLHSVNIFQGHSQPVTTAVFVPGTDKVVSGSDDRTVRVWDLKNMRAPLTTIRTDSSVNRLTVSAKKNWIAIPCDNRHVKLYHLNGERLGRLRRSNRQGHRRMVTSTAWLESSHSSSMTSGCNLITSGFDRKALGWSVAETSTNKE